jgi:polyphosphate kinase
MMHRNLDRRVEVLVKVEAPESKERLKSILDLCLQDNTSSWALDQDGTWSRIGPVDDEPRVNLQDALMEQSGIDA